MAAARAALESGAAGAGLLVFLYLAAALPMAAAGGLAIVGATLIDGTGAPALTEAVIVVDGKKIRSVGPRSLVALPKGVPYVDGRGLFVVPGRLREPAVAAALRDKVRAGTPFERALAAVLRVSPFVPSDATIEPGHSADLALFEKDPRLNLDHLGVARRAFVAGREITP
jgi:hypothetical protein